DSQASPTIYLPLAQLPQPWMTLVVRAAGDPEGMIDPVTRAIVRVDPEIPVLDARTIEEWLDDSLPYQRASMPLLALFAGFALLLAGMGISSVLSYSVRRRVPEIGLRVALGARRADILWMVLGQGLRLALAGLLLGSLGALGLARL